MIALYVNNLLVFFKNKLTIGQIKKLSKPKYMIKDIRPAKYIFRIRIKQDNKLITFKQSNHIEKFLCNCQKKNVNPFLTLLHGQKNTYL